jgi:hypothetical protein
MEKLFDALRTQFPLLTSLQLRSGEAEPEALAPFIGIILAGIEQARHSAFCFVFPQKGSVAPLTAVSYALSKFAVEFEALADDYARRSFEVGQPVQVLPTGHVFEFAGLWNNEPGKFRLRVVDKPDSSRTFPVTDIMRLRPTNRKIPRGKLESALGVEALSYLDALIGTKTFGNTSIIRNQVLYLGARAEFESFLESCRLHHGVGSYTDPVIADFFPIGSIDDEGKIVHDDRYEPRGEPFVGVSPRIENVAEACKIAAPRSKVVLVDTASRITDLGKFDRIIERQNLIIFAESGDDEKLRQLYDRGCKFWRFTAADLELGFSKSGGAAPSPRSGFFGALIRAAANEASCKIEPVSCSNEQLDRASASLEACERALDESETDETRRLLGKLYSVLMRCAGLIQPPSDTERGELLRSIDGLSSEAADRAMWLSDQAVVGLKGACDALGQALRAPSIGTAKGEALAAIFTSLRNNGIETIGVIARNLRQHKDVTEWVAANSHIVPVLLPASLEHYGFFDALICVSWPNAATFQRVLACHSTPVIHLLGYEFERRWLAQFSRRRAQAFRVPSLGRAEKSELIGQVDNPSIDWPEPPARVAPIEAVPVDDGFRIWSFEEKIIRKGLGRSAADGEDLVSASFVSFTGDAYAYLTASNKLPVITELVSGRVDESYAIPRRRLEHIKPGDVVVFREGGKRDVIHALADQRMGAKAADIRRMAARWQHSLQASNLGEAAIFQALVTEGCARTMATVRNWLHDDVMIGPQNESDLAVIARITKDEGLMLDKPRVWQAIRLLKGEHQAAGMRLLQVLLRELPKRVGELRGGRTRIEIENTIGAWIVQVDSIAMAAEPCPRSQVNSLLWDEGGDLG